MWMTVVVATLVLLPFSAWYAYRVWRAINTGAVDTLGDPVHRTSRPGFFWFLVVLYLYLSLILAAGLGFALLGLSLHAVSIVWLAVGCLILSITIALGTSFAPAAACVCLTSPPALWAGFHVIDR